MKTRIETQGAGNPGRYTPGVCLAPSLRIPVTTANRALLRWLRAAELSAWEAGQVCAYRLPPEHALSQPRQLPSHFGMQ